MLAVMYVATICSLLLALYLSQLYVCIDNNYAKLMIVLCGEWHDKIHYSYPLPVVMNFSLPHPIGVDYSVSHKFIPIPTKIFFLY